MVFKGRFFSSKKYDSSSSNNNSPDGSSNSPRSLLVCNSPVRSDKKKLKDGGGGGSFAAAACRQTQVKDGGAKKKESKGKDSPQYHPSTPLKSTTGSSSSKASLAAAADAKDAQPSPPPQPPSSVSPILASSLGLNRTKTRSGPLPQGSFFGFRGDKGTVALGASNLSRPGGGSSSGGSSAGKKKEVAPASHSGMGLWENASKNWADNGSNSDSMSTGSAKSRDQSPSVLPPSRLQNGESSSEAADDYVVGLWETFIFSSTNMVSFKSSKRIKTLDKEVKD